MLEYHGICTILAMTQQKSSTKLKLLLGGLNECIQDNFPSTRDWINAFADNILTKTLIRLQGKQIKVAAVSTADSMELKQICLI